MIKVFNIVTRTFCLLLMIHLMATNIYADYLLKSSDNSTFEQTLDIEEDIDNFRHNKPTEFNDFCEEYLADSLNYSSYHHSFHTQKKSSTLSFKYLQINLPQSISEILIPPPLS